MFIHNIDPVAINFFNIEIRWYSLAYIAGILLGWFFSKRIIENLNSNTILINKSQGGFYLMPEFVTKKFNSSSEMCNDILNKTGVALLPGSDFGFDKKKLVVKQKFCAK